MIESEQGRATGSRSPDARHCRRSAADGATSAPMRHDREGFRAAAGVRLA
jgi:hypothetical protein